MSDNEPGYIQRKSMTLETGRKNGTGIADLHCSGYGNGNLFMLAAGLMMIEIQTDETKGNSCA